MNEVVESVQPVSHLIEEIAHAAQSQRSAIAGVSEAVQLVDRSTQQNAALAEQSTSVARLLQQQAKLLTGTVAGFQF